MTAIEFAVKVIRWYVGQSSPRGWYPGTIPTYTEAEWAEIEREGCRAGLELSRATNGKTLSLYVSPDMEAS